MSRKQNYKLSIPLLEFMFNKAKDGEVDEESIEKKDITNEVIWTIKDQVEHDTFIPQAVFSRPSLGKSTFAMWLLFLGNRLMSEKNSVEMPDCYPKIQSDQIEMNRYRMQQCKKAKDGTLKRKDEFVMIDESASLSDTGENSSIEGATLSDLININAQEFSNPIFVSATSNSDFERFATIIYHIIGVDKPNNITMARVYWHDHPTGRILLLGHIKVDVKEVLESDVNKRYRKKKFARMGLLTSNKRDIRSLERAELLKKCYEDLKPFITGTIKVPPELVELTIKQMIAKSSTPYSIIGESSVRKEVSGILSADHIITKLEKKLSSNLTEEERTNTKKMLKAVVSKRGEIHRRMEKDIRILNKYRGIK